MASSLGTASASRPMSPRRATCPCGSSWTSAWPPPPPTGARPPATPSSTWAGKAGLRGWLENPRFLWRIPSDSQPFSRCLVDSRAEDTGSAFVSPRPRPESLRFLVDAFKFAGDVGNLVRCSFHPFSMGKSPKISEIKGFSLISPASSTSVATCGCPRRLKPRIPGIKPVPSAKLAGCECPCAGRGPVPPAAGGSQVTLFQVGAFGGHRGHLQLL